jgi:hypothetical protein
MSDTFTRQKLNQLTGLTKLGQSSAIPVNLIDATWVDVYKEDDLTLHTTLKAIQMSVIDDPTDTIVYRILAGRAPLAAQLSALNNKIYPFGDDMELISGLSDYFDVDLQIPTAHSFVIQAKATFASGSPKVQLDFLSKITTEVYSHA